MPKAGRRQRRERPVEFRLREIGPAAGDLGFDCFACDARDELGIARGRGNLGEAAHHREIAGGVADGDIMARDRQQQIDRKPRIAGILLLHECDAAAQDLALRQRLVGAPHRAQQ